MEKSKAAKQKLWQLKRKEERGISVILHFQEKGCRMDTLLKKVFYQIERCLYFVVLVSVVGKTIM